MEVSSQSLSRGSHPDAISKRIRKLDNELDIERLSVMFSSGLAVVQYFAGRKKRHWLFRPQVQIPLFLLHAIFRKTPVKFMLRRFGFRTKDEIVAEKEMLMNLLQNDNNKAGRH